MFKRLASIFSFVLLAALPAAPAWADEYSDTIQLFRNAGQSAKFLDTAYGYAVFPTIGKAAVGVGGAHGDGRVFVKGKVVGQTSMSQLSIGLQAGGESYS